MPFSHKRGHKTTAPQAYVCGAVLYCKRHLIRRGGNLCEVNLPLPYRLEFRYENSFVFGRFVNRPYKCTFNSALCTLHSALCTFLNTVCICFLYRFFIMTPPFYHTARYKGVTNTVENKIFSQEKKKSVSLCFGFATEIFVAFFVNKSRTLLHFLVLFGMIYNDIVYLYLQEQKRGQKGENYEKAVSSYARGNAHSALPCYRVQK